MQRKEGSDYSSCSFNLCSSREIGGKETKGAGETVIRVKVGYNISYLPFISSSKELLLYLSSFTY